jgi:hypothetical protein
MQAMHTGTMFDDSQGHQPNWPTTILAGGAYIVVDVCDTGHRVAMRGGHGSARPWLTGNDPRGSKISNLTRASRRGGPPSRARPDYCGCRKPGTIFPVSATVLEPQGGDLTKPRPTAWVSGTPTDTRALKGRDNQSQTYRSSKAIPCASSDCGIGEHLYRPFRAGGNSRCNLNPGRWPGLR